MFMLENGTESFVGSEQLISIGNITRRGKSERATDIVKYFSRLNPTPFASLSRVHKQEQKIVYFWLKSS